MSKLLAVSTALLFAATPFAASAAKLTVAVDGIRKQDGLVLVSLVDSQAGWDGAAKPVGASGSKPDGSERLQFEFADLPAGSYAVKVMHDENGNGQMDKNLIGMPKEGYGYSNNPRVMRPARFEEARFEVATDDASITIELN